MGDKLSMEERLEKLEKAKSREQQLRERAEEIERIKSTPIVYKPKDPTRIHKSKKQKIAERLAKIEEDIEVRRFLAERKSSKNQEQPSDAAEPVKKGRTKKVE